MRWIWFDGEAHALLSIEEDGDLRTPVLVCSKNAEVGDWNANDTNALPEIREATDIHARPFGVDTHPECHAIVKGWALNPGTAPEGLFPPPTTPTQRRAMSAEDRRRVIAGEPREANPEAEGAQTPPRGRSSQGDTVLEPGDDLEFPDEPGPLPVAAGAIVVVPPKSTKRVAKRDPADTEFDS